MKINFQKLTNAYNGISEDFLWEKTPQGQQYWLDVINNLRQNAEIPLTKNNNRIPPWPPKPGTCKQIANDLSIAFVWTDSPQGHDYWMNVAEELEIIKEYEGIVESKAYADYDRAMRGI